MGIFYKYKDDVHRRFAFTLAEVLLTLGIIGVIAAMTIPTLLSNVNSQKNRVRFKKSISTLSQAGLMAYALSDIDYASNSNGAIPCSADANPDTGNYTFCAVFNRALKGHKLSEELPGHASNYNVPDNPFEIENPMYLTLADGTLVIFNSHAANCSKRITDGVEEIPEECVAYVDVNGLSGPNRVVSCQATSNSSEETAGTCGARTHRSFPDDDSPRPTERPSSTCIYTTSPCTVPNDGSHMTDIYPVIFHNSTVEPASDAARYVLSTSK